MTTIRNRRIVSRIQVDNKIVDIYDSDIILNDKYKKAADIKDIIRTYSIPSSRYYYLSQKGFPIPYVALSTDVDQMLRDVSVWHTPGEHKPVYRKSYNNSRGPTIDLVSMIDGIGVSISNISNEYRESMTELFPQEFPFTISKVFISLMAKYPHHPDADLTIAANLSQTNDGGGIQNYLNRIGVITFTYNEISGLSPIKKYFYLTRFYGPPPLGDLNEQYVGDAYDKISLTDEASSIAKSIKVNLDLFKQYQEETMALFYTYNTDPNNKIYEKMGTNNKKAFLNNIYDYIALKTKTWGSNPLTLITITYLNTANKNEIKTFIESYNDIVLISLVGKSEYDTRSQLLDIVADRLSANRAFLLDKKEAALCKYKSDAMSLDDFVEIDQPFIGLGSLLGKLRCVELDSLFDTLEITDENGLYLFRDASNQTGEPRSFTLEELNNIKDALVQARYPIKQAYIDKMNFYIDEFKVQQSSEFQRILPLRSWYRQSDNNKSILKQVFIKYFEIGMYMRQWKGPGNPYPLLKRQTGETVEALGRTPEWVQTNVDKAIPIFTNELDKLPEILRTLIWSLPVYYVGDDGQPEKMNRTIQSRYNQVTSGVFCIRLASAPWSYTGAYYLKFVTGENIAGFDLTAGLEFIS